MVRQIEGFGQTAPVLQPLENGQRLVVTAQGLVRLLLVRVPVAEPVEGVAERRRVVRRAGQAPARMRYEWVWP